VRRVQACGRALACSCCEQLGLGGGSATTPADSAPPSPALTAPQVASWLRLHANCERHTHSAHDSSQRCRPHFAIGPACDQPYTSAAASQGPSGGSGRCRMQLSFNAVQPPAVNLWRNAAPTHDSPAGRANLSGHTSALAMSPSAPSSLSAPVSQRSAGRHWSPSGRMLPPFQALLPPPAGPITPASARPNYASEHDPLTPV